MTDYHIPLFDLGLTVADAVDLMSPVVAGHHTRVAYLAARLAEEMTLSGDDTDDLVLAALLHDIGAFSSRLRQQILTEDELESDHHAELGALFLERFPTFDRIAELVRLHHRRWASTRSRVADADLAGLLHLADRVDAYSQRRGGLLSAVGEVVATVRRQARAFPPAGVAALERLAQRDVVWRDLRCGRLAQILHGMLTERVLILDDADMLEFARLLSHLVDFRSTYTSTHTAGVACTAALLAHRAGLDPERCHGVQLAGFLHDVGKVAIPTEILDKPAGLDPSEWAVMKTHVDHTRRILEGVPELAEVASWAAGHHEKLDGTGYPFRATDIALETRLLAVADVLTALTEDRPYRVGSSPAATREVLQRMVACHHLDPDLVDLAISHQDELDATRAAAQEPTLAAYRELIARSHAVVDGERRDGDG